MPMKDLITEKLTQAFAPQSLDVIDESHLHAGHAGHRPGGETHFRVHIVSEAFRGKSRVDRHRMINQTLSGELAGGVHALAIHATRAGGRRELSDAAHEAARAYSALMFAALMISPQLARSARICAANSLRRVADEARAGLGEALLHRGRAHRRRRSPCAAARRRRAACRPAPRCRTRTTPRSWRRPPRPRSARRAAAPGAASPRPPAGAACRPGCARSRSADCRPRRRSGRRSGR